MTDGGRLGGLLDAVKETRAAVYRMEQEVLALLAEDWSHSTSEPQRVAGAQDEWLTQGELGDWLKVSRTTVYRLIREGQIPTYRIGRSIRVRRADEGREGW